MTTQSPLTKVALVGVMDPAGGSFRIHTLNIARALATRYQVAIVSNFITPFSALERQAFPEGAVVEQIDRKAFFAEPISDDTYLMYQLGNNEHYSWIIDEFLRAPGAVIVHDPSMYWPLSGNPELCETFLDEELGLITGLCARDMLDWTNRPRSAALMAHATLYNRAVLQYATEIFCHSASTTEAMREKFPDTPCHAITLTANFLSPEEIVRVEREPSEKVTFSLLGYQSEYKRVRDVLQAFVKLSQTRTDFNLRCVGRWEGTLRAHCEDDLEELKEQGLLVDDNRYVSEEELSREISTSDLIINLRYPTAGESSGIACQALTLGRPLIVNRYAAFQDLPPQATYQISFAPDGDEPALLAARLAEILDDRATLRRKTEAAVRFGAGTGISAYTSQYLAAVGQATEKHLDRRRRHRSRLRVRGVNDLWRRPIQPDAEIENGRMIWLGKDLCLGALAKGPRPGETAQRVQTYLNASLDRPELFDVRLASLEKFVKLSTLSRENDAMVREAGVAGWIVWVGAAEDFMENIERFAVLVKAAPVGCRFIVPGDLSELMTLTFGSSSHTGAKWMLMDATVNAALKKKFVTELGVYRLGLHHSGEYLNETFGRQLILRKGSSVVEHEYGELPEVIDRAFTSSAH